MPEFAEPSVDDLRAALAAALTAREAAQLVYSEASAASQAAERDYDDALRAVREADPIYDVIAPAMHAADLGGRTYGRDEWCVRVDRFLAALGRRGYQITKVPA